MSRSKLSVVSLVLGLVGCAEAPVGGDPARPGDGPTSGHTSPETAACTFAEVPLEADEPSPIGLAGEDVDAVLAGMRSAAFVHADGAPTDVRVEVAPLDAPVFVDWTALEAGATCPEDTLRVAYEVVVTTTDGLVDVSVVHVFDGAVAPDGLSVNAYAGLDAVAGALEVPAGAESLSVVVHQPGAGGTSGELRWVVAEGGGAGGSTSTGGGALVEVDVGAWGTLIP